mmetsp:Transcript_8258/g.35065  ORF Transcript_8258/g.35065 Transcript_8258/m.35065 type:complete len:346 (+) Transcript_8258:1404-2441(+)
MSSRGFSEKVSVRVPSPAEARKKKRDAPSASSSPPRWRRRCARPRARRSGSCTGVWVRSSAARISNLGPYARCAWPLPSRASASPSARRGAWRGESSTTRRRAETPPFRIRPPPRPSRTTPSTRRCGRCALGSRRGTRARRGRRSACPSRGTRTSSTPRVSLARGKKKNAAPTRRLLGRTLFDSATAVPTDATPTAPPTTTTLVLRWTWTAERRASTRPCQNSRRTRPRRARRSRRRARGTSPACSRPRGARRCSSARRSEARCVRRPRSPRSPRARAWTWFRFCRTRRDPARLAEKSGSKRRRLFSTRVWRRFARGAAPRWRRRRRASRARSRRCWTGALPPTL